MEVIIEALRKEINRKMRRWGIAALAIDGLIFFTILAYKPGPHTDDSAINFAAEQRASTISQRAALEKLATQQAKYNAEMKERDDGFKKDILENRNEIIKTKQQQNENYNRINRMSNADIISAYSNLQESELVR